MLLRQADSGFGSRETSVSPLPSARSFVASTSKMSTSPLRAYQDAYLDGSSRSVDVHQGDVGDCTSLPHVLERLSISSVAGSEHRNSPKRRISRVSSVTQHGRRLPSSTDEAQDAHLMRHRNEVSPNDLVDFSSTSGDDEEEHSETESEAGDKDGARKPLPHIDFTEPFKAPLPPRVLQSNFGKRTSIPARKPLNLRI